MVQVEVMDVRRNGKSLDETEAAFGRKDVTSTLVRVEAGGLRNHGHDMRLPVWLGWSARWPVRPE